MLGDFYLLQGEVDRAIGLIERGWAVAKAYQLQAVDALGMSRLGRAYALSGRSAEGVSLLEQAVEQVSLGSTFALAGISFYLSWLAEAYLLAGRADEAAHTALRGLASAQEHEERGVQGYTFRLLGEIAARVDPAAVDPARAHYRQALALADELGMRPLAAHCHLGLGTLYQRAGSDEQARVELSTAAEMYRAMAMTSWLEKAELTLTPGAG